MRLPRRRWVDRTFQLDVPLDAMPDLLMRVRGTPARLEELMDSIPDALWTRPQPEGWSIQRNVGHLIDLEGLWRSRVEDFATGRARLTAWDVENRATEDADWDSREMAELLRRFREVRTALVGALEGLSLELLRGSSLHPRLVVPVTAAGLALFVAEHDDHHLATIHRIAFAR